VNASPDPSAASPSASPSDAPYVSRGAFKLAHALAQFSLDVRGRCCADFGCSTGGFTDVLLRAGAQRVYAVDTAYGILAWKLRKDPRVAVLERTNCLHAAPPADLTARGGADLIVIDASWTPQHLVLPAALRWLHPAPHARIISLIKPHYELKTPGIGGEGVPSELPKGGVLSPADALVVAQRVRDAMPALGLETLGLIASPVLGGGGEGTKKPKGSGNVEWLWIGRRAAHP
jgi:23S rRNA (cytidine1920-2'-O)/16S rRNA (cytidine1409-2'-O)-methyltransferase